MPRKTKAEIQAEQERLEQEMQDTIDLETYRARKGDLDKLDDLTREVAQLRGEAARLREETKKAQINYQRLTDEWNTMSAQYKIPPPKAAGERTARGEMARHLAERLLQFAFAPIDHLDTNHSVRAGDLWDLADRFGKGKV